MGDMRTCQRVLDHIEAADGRLTDVMPSLAAALGHAQETRVHLGGLERASHVVLVVVDGLGWHQLRARSAHARLALKPALETGLRLVTCVPSTTAAALSSLTCAALPGRTGMLGYEVAQPEHDRVVQLLAMKERGTGRVIEPSGWNRVPTIFEALAHKGSSTCAIVPRRFVGSGLTSCALKGATLLTAETLRDRVEAAIKAARSYDLTYLYFEFLDHCGHAHGWDSPQWLDTLEAIDRSVDEVRRKVGDDTLVALTADHGMVNPDSSKILDLADCPELTYRYLAGEPRALHVHLRAGADVEEESRRWAHVVGDRADVVAGADLVRLLGEVADDRRGWVGDLWVFSRERALVVDRRVHTAGARSLKGVHGSLTPEELDVPFLVVS